MKEALGKKPMGGTPMYAIEEMNDGNQSNYSKRDTQTYGYDDMTSMLASAVQNTEYKILKLKREIQNKMKEIEGNLSRRFSV